MSPRSRHRSSGDPARDGSTPRTRSRRSSTACCGTPANCWRSAAPWTQSSSSARSWAPGGATGSRTATCEEVIGEALVDHAASAGTPAALALLTGIAYMGTPRQAAKAERAALELMGKGVARPGWADRVGMVTAEGCHVSRDVFGDQDSIVCVYSYGGTERHALVVLVDRNKAGAVQTAGEGFAPAAHAGRPPVSGMVRDAWVSSQVDKLLAHCRREGRENPLMRFEELDPRDTRALLRSALASPTPSTSRRSTRTSAPTTPSSGRGWTSSRRAAGCPSRRCTGATGGRRSPRGSSPPTRPKGCPTARPPAAAPT